MKQLPLGVRLHDRAVWASFQTAGSQQAVQGVQHLAAAQAGSLGWLWGPSGSGKSHLLQAVCAQLPGSGYFPMQQLMSFGPAVLEGIEVLCCVCLDDVQALAGQPDWEAALFRLYVEIEARQGRLLLAADQPAVALPWVLADLRSRCTALPHWALQLLDEAQQRTALQTRARLRGLELPDDTAAYLQRHYPRDMHSLMCLLDTLDLASLAEQRRLTVPFIRAVLSLPTE
jgi:DnaA family protein